MKNIIDKVYEQKMNDGTVEKIVSDILTKCYTRFSTRNGLERG